MAGEILAKGLAIAAGNGAAGAEVFTVIPGVTGISEVPVLTIPKVAVTALDSAGEEFIPGIGAAPDLSFVMNLRKATPTSLVYLPAQNVLFTWLNDGMLHNFTITLPGTLTGKVTFAAFVSKCAEQAGAPGSPLTAAVTLTVSRRSGARMSLLTREAIFAAADLPASDVAVPEWGGMVRVRTMSARDRDAFEMAQFEARKEGATTSANIRAHYAAACIVGEDGEQLFSIEDVEQLGMKSGIALDRVYEAVVALNKISATDIEDMAKNSSGGRAATSSSGSRSRSAAPSENSKPA